MTAIHHDDGRIEILDVFRGFAVCGILFNNILYFSGYEFIPASQRNLFGTLDSTIYSSIDFFITSKFYTLFSILFGIGFFLQQKSLQDKTKFKRRYKRRLFTLLAFGIIHGIFIWYGDILLMYSLMGFGLLWTINAKPKTLLYWASILLLLVNIAGVLMLLFKPDIGNHSVNSIAGVADPAYLDYPDMRGTEVLHQINSLNAFQLFHINFHNLVWKWASYLLSFRPFVILGFFILGYYFMKISFLQTVLPRPKFLIISGFVGVGSTMLSNYIGGSVLKFPSTWENETYKILDLAGQIGLCFFYMALIYHFYNSKTGKRILSIFIPAGKMAFSFYILQSILCISIFYFGRIAGQVSLERTVFIAICVNIVIGLFAIYWIRKHKTGPLEKIWRMIYQKK